MYDCAGRRTVKVFEVTSGLKEKTECGFIVVTSIPPGTKRTEPWKLPELQLSL